MDPSVKKHDEQIDYQKNNNFYSVFNLKVGILGEPLKLIT